MNIRIKLFLLLTFGFVFLFTQNSLAVNSYTDAIAFDGTIMSCASSKSNGGGIDRWSSSIKDNEMCILNQSLISKKLRQLNDYGINVIGLEIQSIKVPYSIAQNIWKTIESTGPSYPSGKELITEKVQSLGACAEDNRTAGNSSCSKPTFISKTLLSPTFSIPEIFDNVKKEIIRSCLPGNITTATSGNRVVCCKITKNTPVVATFPSNNYSTWPNANQPWEGCGPLINSMSLTVNKPENPENKRIEVSKREPFTLSWSLSNPSAKCSIIGLDANDPTKPLTYQIAVGEVGIDARTGAIEPKTDQTTFERPVEGIYKYTFSCNGVINGRESANTSRKGISPDLIPEIIKTVYVGDIPPDPVITFNLVTPNENLKKAPDGASYDYSIFLNQTFELGWSVTNLDKVKNTEALPIIIKRLEKSSGNTSTLTSSRNTVSKTSPIRLPSLGNHELYLEATNPDFPGLTSKSQSIIIRVKLATTENILDIDFSADKTLIDKGESVELSWDASDAAAPPMIDQGIGRLATKVGKMTVYPTSATSYTLTAKSPIVNIPDTKKIVTINVKGGDITPIDIKPFEIATSTATILPEQEGKPTTDKIDLRVNGSDGPITLSAPAKFALSWNLNTYCLATGSWLSIKTKAGSEGMSLNKNGKYTYSLYCPGYGTDSVVVEVVNSNVNGLLNAVLGSETETISMPIAEAVVSTDFINYSRDIKVIRGEPVNIYIKIDQDNDNDGKTTRDASGLWSDLISNSGYCLYNNDLVKGTPLFNGMIESPADAQSCNTKLGTFTFNDEPGTYQYGVFRILQNDQKFSNIANINIIVENPPTPTSAPVIDLKINGDDATEQILGTPASFNVSWSVTNADICEASGSWSGTKDLNGIQSFISSSKKDFIYTLTCTGELGVSAKSISLKVTEAPTCSFTALPPLINKQSAFVTDSQLSWKCDYTDECNLSPNTTNAIIKTYGSLRVSPTQTTNYILSCTNSDVSRSFESKVEIINE